MQQQSRFMAQLVLDSYVERKRRAGVAVEAGPIRFTANAGSRGWWRCEAVVTRPDGRSRTRKLYFHNSGQYRYWRLTR